MKPSKSATRRTGSGYQRRNFTLSTQTALVLDHLPPEVNRSELVDGAIQKLVRDRGLATLRRSLAEGYKARASRDLRIAEEWFGVDEEAWEHTQATRRRRR